MKKRYYVLILVGTFILAFGFTSLYLKFSKKPTQKEVALENPYLEESKEISLDLSFVGKLDDRLEVVGVYSSIDKPTTERIVTDFLILENYKMINFTGKVGNRFKSEIETEILNYYKPSLENLVDVSEFSESTPYSYASINVLEMGNFYTIEYYYNANTSMKMTCNIFYKDDRVDFCEIVERSM